MAALRERAVSYERGTPVGDHAGGIVAALPPEHVSDSESFSTAGACLTLSVFKKKTRV